MVDLVVRGAGGKGGGGGGHETDDTLFSNAYIELVEAVSEGEIAGLLLGPQSIYLDSVPITAADGTQNHQCAWDQRFGLQSQAPFTSVQNVSAELSIGVEVQVDVPHTEIISDTSANFAVITMGFPRMMAIDNSGNVNGTRVEFKIEYQDLGTAGGPYILVSRNAQRTLGGYDSGHDYYASPSNAFSAEIHINSNSGDPVSILYSTDGNTFLTLETVDMVANSGIFHLWLWQYSANTVVNFDEGHYYLRLPANSSVAWYSYSGPSNAVVDGKCGSRYQKQYRFPLHGIGPWSVRVTRVTPTSTSAKLSNQLFVDSLRTETAVRLIYPNTALVYLKILAKEFGSPPARRYWVKGIKVLVPDNYDPTTRSYSGLWTGGFKVAWTDNPAWCFYDLCINTRYGLGNYISSLGIDKWALYKIAQYCDGMVDSGRRTDSGAVIYEPRFTLNIQIKDEIDAYTLLKNLASVFRGMVYVVNGLVTASCDMPADPVKLFTPANVINGAFEFTGSGGVARKSVALVQLADPYDHYNVKVEYVPDRAKIARYGVNNTEIVAFGCTSRGQAHRLGKWILIDGETVSFSVGHDAALVKPGDIIQCMIPLRNQGKRLGGRVKTIEGVTVVLDASVTLVDGHRYMLYVALADGSTACTDVVTAAGDTDTLTLASGLDAVVDYAIWVLADLDGITPTLWRVLGVAEQDDRTIAMTALSYHVNYDAIDSFDTPFDSSNTPSINPITVPAVSNIAAELAPYTDKNNLTQNGVMLHWTQVMQASAYQVRWRLNNGNWQTEPPIYGNHFEMAVKDGDYDFSVVAVNALGRRSPATAISTTISGNASAINFDAQWSE
ncbi:host specificity protein J [Methylovulum psychrotolerans]|uniref:host specificity protein J n=1 Tax=Methylovulum psychrotolerans TaxID=1704499 RepID=UPI001BFF3B34|nr:phage tail protein [Methylovulum psychrotolerans]MBT9097518.1 host specificity protein J [Methylovulum psychrotolerans]